jgi:hypothetical protein
LSFKEVTRQPEDLHFIHRHLPDQGTIFSRRLLDEEKDAKIHVLAWRFHIKRKRWEAVCEWSDIIYYAAPTAADLKFRKGRSYE